MRVAILGNSGSGKSTLAGRLATRVGVAPLDLDTIAWVPGLVAVARPIEEALLDLRAHCKVDADWIVEGCYARLVDETLAHNPTLIFLDPGVEVCLAHCRARPWEAHKYASKEEQDAGLGFLLGWVRQYYEREDDHSHARHRALFDRYDGPKHLLEFAPGEDWLPPGWGPGAATEHRTEGTR